MTYTYERDGGCVRSWIDHVVCNESYSSLINQLHLMNSGINLSDHLPISFTLDVPVCVGHNSQLKCSSPIEKSCNSSKVEQHHIDKYRHLLSADIPPDFACCCEPDCTGHTKILDSYSATFVKCLVDAASLSIPHHSRPPGCTLAGWNHGPNQLKKQANFWYKVRGVGRILKGGFPCEAHSSLGGSGGMPPQKFFEIWLSDCFW